MTIIDAQLHEPAVSLPWASADEATRNDVMLELQIGFMRAAGVDRAVLFPVDLAWGRRAVQLRPDLFAIVPMITAGGALGGIDASAPNVEEVIAALAGEPGVVGVRVMRRLPARLGAGDRAPIAAFDRAITASAAHGLPMFISSAGDLAPAIEIAESHPGLTLVIDHLGLAQPPEYERESPPFRSLADLLELARHPNIALKLSGVPSLSEQEYPFTDVWPHVRRVIDTFGPDRLMWGSDISRIMGQVGFTHQLTSEPFAGQHTYAEALHYVLHTDQLSAAEKEWILGGTVRKLLRWPD
ncbi:MAG TPA: amidohydrolase family protein [Ilumatobacter sp.]|nr:amidohydrolase family protein [Ilumatobacter sp.]